ncbi:hypothetical protein THIOKS11310004 [Thiocapsa sp. KS1]|nr:hypothetical protein [Thiocapsa sp. KS1]CRI63314.1 hypothetical protein THIOKS11310004 [Thiocapsa sp. KS1]
MQAIIERLEGLLERLKRVNYERLFVVSVLVATLTGSLYLYLVDFYFARSPDQAVALDPAIVDRIAPIGRVTLAAPAVETAAAATEAPADASPPAEPSAESAVAEAAISDAASTDAGSTGVAARSDASPGLSPDQAEAQAPISADPLAVQPVSADAGGAAPVAAMPSVPSADLPISGPAATAGPPRQAPTYPVPPGYMPMPAQGYAPVYPSYQPPPAASRQAPVAPSWYGAPGPYQAYPPNLYERSAIPPAGYPPQGWMR